MIGALSNVPLRPQDHSFFAIMPFPIDNDIDAYSKLLKERACSCNNSVFPEVVTTDCGERGAAEWNIDRFDFWPSGIDKYFFNSNQNTCTASPKYLSHRSRPLVNASPSQARPVPAGQRISQRCAVANLAASRKWIGSAVRDTLAQYRRKVTASVVSFHPGSKSSGSRLLPLHYLTSCPSIPTREAGNALVSPMRLIDNDCCYRCGRVDVYDRRLGTCSIEHPTSSSTVWKSIQTIDFHMVRPLHISGSLTSVNVFVQARRFRVLKICALNEELVTRVERSMLRLIEILKIPLREIIAIDSPESNVVVTAAGRKVSRPPAASYNALWVDARGTVQYKII
ncbi:hypothetical protein EVAR_39964_1 [Eumeta japonica]|uniref:Uncharacterized protein n=1 Tax=Eumeta variegata TaxID=151549 RepID=A0A4C1X550_EUMVA|nr:hypothetical protein EVAR_39964_1 [Eumeta japonica]